MNYPPNTTRWCPGAIVYHDGDAKQPQMLMRVVGYDRATGECITCYLQPDRYYGMRGTFRNIIDVLHDPARFGMSV